MPDWTPPTEVNLVDLGFMDSRSKLIDLAAFLDRVQRAGQEGDFRVQALKNAIALLSQDQPQRARDVLLSFSDPSTTPVEKAAMQGAIGAYKNGGSPQWAVVCDCCSNTANHRQPPPTFPNAIHRAPRPHGQPHHG